MKNLRFIIYIITFVVIVTSCQSTKKVSYFQDINLEEGTFTKVLQQHESKICKGDLLSIVVSTQDPTVSAPFNLPIVSYASPNSDQLYTQAVLQTYLVDNDGNIDFPVIGKMSLSGLKKSEAIALIQEQLKPYLKDPIINIKITNYKVSVLGEVNKPGSFDIQNERVTFLEALALAGDLTIYGKRNNVLIFRESENGEKSISKIDLTTEQLFNSPYYYLQQNDIIYVEPNKTKANLGSYNPNVPIIISAISTAITMISVIYSISK